MAGIIGRKLGMTQVFSDTGAAVPVTVIEAGPCPVVQVRDSGEGQAALQLGWGERKAHRTPRAALGHAKKAGLEAAPVLLREFRVASTDGYEVGQTLTVEQFTAGDKVRVTGNTKGRGFQGVVKRHGFTGRPASHGHPLKRNPGTLGPGTNPSRVIKGKKMPGQMGASQKTVLNLRIEQIDAERNLIYIRGAVPGARNSLVFIRKM
jgi:large subunit ribosomal protein L3